MRRSFVGAVSLFTVCCLHSPPQEKVSPQSNYSVHETIAGSKVHVSNFVLNRLLFLYDGLPRELPVCLLGRSSGDEYWVDDVDLPLYVYSEPDSASYNRNVCDSETYIGMVHQHRLPPGVPPETFCLPSLLDTARFMRDEEAELEMIVCKADRKGDGIGYALVVKKDVQR